IRCRKSLELLTALVKESEGAVQVVIRGRPALDQFDDFHKQVTSTPGLRFEGPYKPADLPKHYAEVHFTWAIDLFEEGMNSSWLLPNRLYEGGAFAAVPIALAHVETGRFLEHLNIGIRLNTLDLYTLMLCFASLNQHAYEQLHAACAAVPALTWVADTQTCEELVAHIKRVAA
ncbi:MAG: glycosyl transferase family 1, partial [Rickettsiales bacterium]|nr:glycosyl transferase family 1 [Rickettsiales bacterium]